jgi:hypothetical protein
VKTSSTIIGGVRVKTIIAALSLAVIVGISASVNAALVDRGVGMIYDTVLDITWLQDANYAQTSGYDSDARMRWNDAVSWANQLEYGGLTKCCATKFSSFNIGSFCLIYFGSSGKRIPRLTKVKPQTIKICLI